MAGIERKLTPQGYPYVLNSPQYKDTTELYESGVSGLNGRSKDGGFRKKYGLAVTVTIPPSLRAFRYPNLTAAGASNYYLTQSDKEIIRDRQQWYNAARANAAYTSKSIVTLTRRRKSLVEQRKKAVDEKNTARTSAIDAEIKRIDAQLANLKANTSAKIIGTYSTEFEISDFITSLTWSSASTNSFIDVSIGLDNTHGLFNHLPEGAKVTIWRRKSLTNGKGLYAGKWYRYITSYIFSKTRSASSRGDQTMAIECGDRLSFAGAQNYTGKSSWVTDKSHKNGWTPREITLQICKATKLPVDAAYIPSSYIIKKKVTRGTGRNRKVSVTYETVKLPRIQYDQVESTDIPSLIIGAWNRSLAELPRNKRLPYSMHMRQGALRIEFVAPPGDPLTQVTEPNNERSRLVPRFTDEDNIESITLEESIEPDQVYTVLKATGVYNNRERVNGKLQNKPKKVTKLFFPSGDRGKRILEAFGRRTAVYDFSKKMKKNFTTREAFYRAAQQRIDNISQTQRSLSLEGLGPLGIWPKHYVYLSSRYVGVRGHVWVESVSYTVGEGVIKVSLEVQTGKKHYSSGEQWYTTNEKIRSSDRWY